MKIRQGFVSNSSSSSFVLVGRKVSDVFTPDWILNNFSEEEIENAKKEAGVSKKFEIDFNDWQFEDFLNYLIKARVGAYKNFKFKSVHNEDTNLIYCVGTSVSIADGETLDSSNILVQDVVDQLNLLDVFPEMKKYPIEIVTGTEWS